MSGVFQNNVKLALSASVGASNTKPTGGCWVLKKPKNGFPVIVR